MPSGAEPRRPAPGDAAIDARAVEQAVQHLARGGLVAFPTETVWGLAADACSERAVAGLRAWKGRDAEQPISVLVSSLEALPVLGVEVSASVHALAERFWPGPLTLVVPTRSHHGRRGRRGAAAAASAEPMALAAGIARADGGLGVRCSPHPTARALAAAAERAGLGPPTATSFNRSGEPPALSADQARALAAGGVGAPFVLATGAAAGAAGGAGREAPPASGSPVDAGSPSTVLDLCRRVPRLLREGAIGVDEIAETLGEPVERAPRTRL